MTESDASSVVGQSPVPAVTRRIPRSFLRPTYDPLRQPNARTTAWWASPADVLWEVIGHSWVLVPIVLVAAMISTGLGAAFRSGATGTDGSVGEVFFGFILFFVGIITAPGLLAIIVTVASCFLLPYVENLRVRLWWIGLLCIVNFVSGALLIQHWM